jgi:hypothetical protein
MQAKTNPRLAGMEAGNTRNIAGFFMFWSGRGEEIIFHTAVVLKVITTY